MAEAERKKMRKRWKRCKGDRGEPWLAALWTKVSPDGYSSPYIIEGGYVVLELPSMSLPGRANEGPAVSVRLNDRVGLVPQVCRRQSWQQTVFQPPCNPNKGYLIQFDPLLSHSGLGVLQTKDPEFCLHQIRSILLHCRDIKADNSEVGSVVSGRDDICKMLGQWLRKMKPIVLSRKTTVWDSPREPCGKCLRNFISNGQFNTTNNLTRNKTKINMCV